ncbi:MAG: hypothetical protein B7Y05_03250 [Polynucleobacter sp. 24-46-87]|jgi:hypothetical protein|uniref:DUF3306 domain-containing protein n=1 Tax=unclassified Polynucleobacter TaxID=2640945 RepID=UPI000BC9F0F6|nr:MULTISPECIES: DUF3306 domain-containing protein [unclassified Polynucleobacter]OYY21428.1 MAG: hypothetical protein B7Y67_01780 [Polynucleobacter sp. 35-46-11]OZA15607.1 MAG: hypothetical protein B7Y05_03250 [Polynucleobacter sp. 24-46-87]OZA77897.1 MAG: hypothetical protein B7X71_03020 [Polynucleobacter sp. 39-46-10]
MAGGFLNRWSRLKSGEQLEPEKKPSDQLKQELASSSEANKLNADAQETPPSATLEDVEKIDRFAPDFSAFMKPDVDPAVQQAAMKKMFSDPHFNIMDGLDIYIDDYSKPDPIPLEMLKRMVQSDMLNIFRKDDEENGPSTQTSANPVSGQEEQALPLAPQTDLTSTPTPIQEVGDKDPLSVDKKTS